VSPFIFFTAASVARADCVAEIRQVVLDKTISVPLKSYRCKTGADQNAPQIRIEFHRLSDLAASLMISNTSSTMLTKTFGAIKVVENDVSKPMAICSSNSEPLRSCQGTRRSFDATIDQRRSSKGGRPSFRRGYDRFGKSQTFYGNDRWA